MPWFFTQENFSGDQHVITGEDAAHISKALRMSKGEGLTLVTPDMTQCECEVFSITSDSVTVDVLSRKKCENEPDVRVTLYQALLKGDKMDYVIQKCVELGVSKIVPVITARCISRPDKKSIEKKRARWQKIALQAAMQSRRGTVPRVGGCMSLDEAARDSLKNNERTLFFYELGGRHVDELLPKKPLSVGMFIGSEGGFEAQEAKPFEERKLTATLGKRILRAETAPLAALSIVMFKTGNF